MSDIDVTNVVVFDVIRALNRVALNQNRNVVFTRSTAFCFILTVAIYMYSPVDFAYILCCYIVKQMNEIKKISMKLLVMYYLH